jgi:hypothetical protein
MLLFFLASRPWLDSFLSFFFILKFLATLNRPIATTPYPLDCRDREVQLAWTSCKAPATPHAVHAPNDAGQPNISHGTARYLSCSTTGAAEAPELSLLQGSLNGTKQVCACNTYWLSHPIMQPHLPKCSRAVAWSF